MNVLITGGAGYVGSVVSGELLRCGHEVCVYDDLWFGGNGILSLFRHPNFTFVKGDIRDIGTLKEHLKNAEVVIHLAAVVGYPACKRFPDLAKSVNVDGTIGLVNAMSKEQMVVYASTGSNYGSVKGICTEETPLNPLTLYAETKVKAEEIIMQRENAVGYRFATAFGVSTRMRLDLLVNDFVSKALNDKYIVVYQCNFMRTFIHVFDMACAFEFALCRLDKMRGEVFNVGSDKMNASKLLVCETIRKYVDYYLHVADYGSDEDMRNYEVSYDKIAALGYSTTIGVEEGIPELANAISVLSIHDPYTSVPVGRM